MSAPLSSEPVDSMSMVELVRFQSWCLPLLRKLKSTAQPPGKLSNETFWSTIKLVDPAIAKIQEATVLLEEKYGSGTWESLDEWIAGIEKRMDSELESISQILDINSPNPSKALQNLHAGAISTQGKRNLGPHWERSLDKCLKMWGFSIGIPSIPSHMISGHLDRHTGAILSAWEGLKDMDRRGMMGQFRAKWTSLNLATREAFLRKLHGSFHESPNAYVYEIANLQESEWKRIGRKAFNVPLLNIDDLTRGDNLPCLLESRPKTHPRLFLPIDGRGVTTGLFCGCLPELRCDGRLSDNIVNEGYSFQWNAEGLYNPAAIYHQLDWQSQVYRFLHACAENTRSLHFTPPEVEEKARAIPSSLIAQMVRTDYAPSNTVDFKFILDLLCWSFNDSSDDFYDLRTDEDFWNTRMSSTTQDRRSTTFLRNTLEAMDRFDRLKTLLETLLYDGMSGSIPGIQDLDECKGYVHLEVALRLALDDITSTVSRGNWPQRIANKSLLSLINLIREQNTVLWVIGHGVVMRAIDHELLKGNDGSDLPSEMMRALHDMSVVAYCLRETQKYHLFLQSPQYHRHAQLSQDLEDDWRKRDGALRSLANDAICLMDEEEWKKLDNLFLRKDLDLDDKHRQFWNKVDDFMGRASLGKSTRSWFEKIQSEAPLRSRELDKVVQVGEYHAPVKDFLPGSQVKKSKGRRPLWKSTTEVTTRTAPNHGLRSSVKITVSPTLGDEVYGFWKTLIDANTKETFTWSGFCNAMRGVGYEIQPQMGSAYRFKLDKGETHHAIVFHEPHGHGDQTQPMRNARKWWLARLQRHVELELIK